MYHTEDRKPVLVHPGSARAYEMGRIKAYFHADGKETAGRYSISEWWLEPFTQGPGAHSHEHDDDVFYVLEGVMSFLVGETWVDAARGSFVLAPAGVTHAFENRGSIRSRRRKIASKSPTSFGSSLARFILDGTTSNLSILVL
jgi:mannose-6-phosphate isomerase-like protein (cupin superfamily)